MSDEIERRLNRIEAKLNVLVGIVLVAATFAAIEWIIGRWSAQGMDRGLAALIAIPLVYIGFRYFFRHIDRDLN